jgi:outer membrane protein assembly factor BamB
VKPVVNESTLLLAHRDGLSVVSQKTADVKWSISTAERITEPVLHRDIAVFGSQDGRLFGVDVASSSTRWQIELPEEQVGDRIYRGIMQRPLVDGEDIYLLTNGGNLSAMQLAK